MQISSEKIRLSHSRKMLTTSAGKSHRVKLPLEAVAMLALASARRKAGAQFPGLPDRPCCSSVLHLGYGISRPDESGLPGPVHCSRSSSLARPSWSAGISARPYLGGVVFNFRSAFGPHRPAPGTDSGGICVFRFVLAFRYCAIFCTAFRHPLADGSSRGPHVVHDHRNC